MRTGVDFTLPLATLFVVAITAAVGDAVDTPWVLGDEASVACYTLKSKEDIPKPVGLEMHWTTAPAKTLYSDTPSEVKYWARVQDNFWTHPSNVALLGADYAKYYRLCLNETGGCDANGDCCIWHSNIHSCRAESGACEPWVGQANATDDSGQQYTLVTHTAALEGGLEEFKHDVQLDTGDWIIIAHVKIMSFQCAVGATRHSYEPVEKDNTSTIVLATVIPGVCLLAVVIAIVAILLRKSVQGEVRDISDAPKEGQVTLLFTDIQDSTNLWSNYTASMAVSLDIHHEVIRKCIKEHHGYEVKTAGDAFMIAVKTPHAGMKIARDIQVELMKREWPRCITHHYLGEELEDKPDQLEAAPPGAAWHGCRVRVGVHTGNPDITFDEVAKGYDYYGPPVNLSARVEGAACGGQILTSRMTKDELDVNPVEGVRLVPQGHIIPKGLSEPHEVFTAHVDAIGKREFEELMLSDAVKKLALGGDDQEDTSNSFGNSMSGRRSIVSMSVHSMAQGSAIEVLKIVERVVEQFKGDIPTSVVQNEFDDRVSFLKLMIKPLPKGKQGAYIEQLCNAWRVKYNRNNLTSSMNNLVGRMLPAEKAKLYREVQGAQDHLSSSQQISFDSPSGRSFMRHGTNKDMKLKNMTKPAQHPVNSGSPETNYFQPLSPTAVTQDGNNNLTRAANSSTRNVDSQKSPQSKPSDQNNTNDTTQTPGSAQTPGSVEQHPEMVMSINNE